MLAILTWFVHFQLSVNLVHPYCVLEYLIPKSIMVNAAVLLLSLCFVYLKTY